MSFPRPFVFWWINVVVFFLVEIATAVDPGGAEPVSVLFAALLAYLAVATAGAIAWALAHRALRRFLPDLPLDPLLAFAVGALLLLTKLPAAFGGDPVMAGLLALVWLVTLGVAAFVTFRQAPPDPWTYLVLCFAVWMPAIRLEHLARIAETHSPQVVISSPLAWTLASGAALWLLLVLGAEKLGVRRQTVLSAGTAAMTALIGWRLMAPSPFDLGLEKADERLGRGTPLIVIVMDTTRADHLSLYGYPRSTSPELERFAEDAVVYEHALSTSSWTLPAHASLFTGLFPLTHGALRLPGLAEEKESLASQGIHRPAYPLPQETPTLAEHLQAEGFATGAMVSNFAYLDPVFGVSRGFETYFNVRNTPIRPMILRLVDRRIQALPWARRHWQVYRSAEQINHLAFEWLEAQETHRFFLFLNYMEPHLPWGPHQPGLRYEEFAAEETLPARPRGTAPPESSWKRRVDLYDSNIATLDQQLGIFFDRLREMELYDRSLIVITSDHGESFGENGADGHGKSLNEAEVWVPLLVKYPQSREQGRRSERVQLVDLAGSLSAELQRPFPARVDGGLFVELGVEEELAGAVGQLEGIDGGTEPGVGESGAVQDPDGKVWLRVAEMYGDPTDKTEAYGGYQVALYDGERKLLIRDDGAMVFTTVAGGLENPAEIPAALRSWAEGQREEMLKRRELLELRAKARQQALELDPELQKGLEALGYL